MTLPPLREGRRWVVQSCNAPLFLEREYDEAQLWLPFVEHIYFQVSDEKPRTLSDLRKAHNASKDKINKGAARTYALNSENDRYVYLWQKDFEQRVLPFPEHRMISHKHFARLHREGCPGWDRADDGSLLQIEAHPDAPTRGFSSHQRRTDVEEWCREHTRGCFHITNSAKSVIFERREDAMLFKLTYC